MGPDARPEAGPRVRRARRALRAVGDGIGTVVFAYGAAYLPLHLEHEGRPAAEGRRFWPWMTLFMVSMVGLACARDLILLFVFFDLTAVA
jgi:multicomponent Na+:H+ antiporter subunit A